MTERDRIILSLSPSERAIYARLGGTLPSVMPRFVPDWFQQPTLADQIEEVIRARYSAREAERAYGMRKSVRRGRKKASAA